MKRFDLVLVFALAVSLILSVVAAIQRDYQPITSKPIDYNHVWK
ncbi:hypothetical protein [Carboxydothermus ferrireducens]|uniref:Cyclic lactone autoinducer peptide n=1 Tax=Carboxydothermus ferrireducens DSM 11255 TaxID=1119529 RepID=A0ABX2R7K5_9THEO|nr:hypothetical protein [Carboxydothermus ferrireducens]NYE57156.1 hypothetical protein [Carboxydothermus ferrireducens DSM 11255]